MQFRQAALAKLNEPPELDAPARLTRPQSWVVLVVLALVVVGGGVWAATGELPRKVNAQGILTRLQGSFTLQSPADGQITSVFVSQGTSFPSGTPLLSVRTGGQTEIVKAMTPGRATAVFAKVGQVVTAGTELAVVERIDEADDRLVAVLYVTAGPGAMIRPGDEVDLTVQSVPSQEYGVLRGKVVSISQFAENRQQIADFLGDSQLGERFTTGGQPLKVVVDLTLSPGTASGYQWSTKDGPPYRIDSRALVTGAVHLPSIKPIEWMRL